MSEPRRECKLYPYQVAALESFTRSMAMIPVGQPLRTTALMPASSRLWVDHRRT